MPQFPSDPDDETLQSIVEAPAKSGQAVSNYDAEDKLRYANETYRGMFLRDYEGPFTFTDILRYGATSGFGVRVDDGDVEARIARPADDPGSTANRARPPDHAAVTDGGRCQP